MPAADDFYRDKKVLITGGSGFVGRNLAARLLAAGAEVTIVDVRSDPDAGLPPAAKVFALDVARYSDLRAAIHEIRPRLVFHLASIVTAARDPDLIDPMIEANLKGTTNLLRSLDGLEGLAGVVNLGTCEEYGDRDALLRESMREEPASPYAILKLATTRFCRMFSRLYRLPVTTVRPAGLFGPGQARDKLVPSVILACLENRAIRTTAGEQKRNFLFIDDFVAAVLLVARKERRLGRIYNVGSDDTVSVRALVEIIREMTRSESPLDFGALDYRDGEMMTCDLDLRRIGALGWAPKHDLREGLRRTIEFYKGEARRP